MELTPELFEKTEFTERRKGYDIEQVETFLEQTGTALAQLLARTRHIEERAAHAEARLAQADTAVAEARQRALDAEQRREVAERSAQEASQRAAAAATAAARQNEDAEVEQAAKTLLMAKRTAEATVNEARGQAQALLEDSQNRAQRQLNEANAEASELIRRATEQAQAELADRRTSVLDEVQGLEGRRARLVDIITQLESRLAGYREELGRTAQEITALADDPTRLGPRPNMSMAPDEVLSVEPESPESSGGDPIVDATPEPIDEEAPEQADTEEAEEDGVSTGPSADAPIETDLAAAPQSAVAAREAVVDESAPVVGAEVADDRWGPGSWSEIEAELVEDSDVSTRGDGHLDRPTEAVDTADVPRDRFMEELDSAVNEAVTVDQDEDAAMTAFFEGTSDTRTRRFGWRR